MDLGISKAINDGNGNTIIYTALLAAILANCTPTIADGLYFNLQQKWNEDKATGKITPERYWANDAIGYYGITAGYYGALFLTMLALGNTSYSTKSKILLSIIGGGVVIGVVMKNAQKDKEFISQQKLQKTQTTTA